MPTVNEMRDAAKEHSRQIEAVLWLSVADLAGRWGVSAGTVRKLDRTLLPYLTLGASGVRRYDPRDVEEYERTQKSGRAAA